MQELFINLIKWVRYIHVVNVPQFKILHDWSSEHTAEVMEYASQHLWKLIPANMHASPIIVSCMHALNLLPSVKLTTQYTCVCTTRQMQITCT